MLQDPLEIYLDAEQERARGAARRENQPRLAFINKTLSYAGSGAVRLDGAIDFGLAFVHEPAFSSGRSLVKAPPADYQLPIGDVVITGWITDERELYTGCSVYLSVYAPLVPGMPAPTVAPDIEMVFHLSFMGTALKDVARIPGAGERAMPTRLPGL